MGENSSFPPLIATEENKRDANLRSEHERRAHCKWRGKFTRFEANMSACEADRRRDRSSGRK